MKTKVRARRKKPLPDAEWKALVEQLASLTATDFEAAVLAVRLVRSPKGRRAMKELTKPNTKGAR